MKLSVIIPVYNESNTIEQIVKKVQEVELPKEIIIVDDGSTDGTREILASLDMENVVVVYHKHNKGKGQAIRTALPLTTGDVIIIQDADLEYNPSEYPKLVEPIEKGEAEVVYGSRVLGRRAHFGSFMAWLFYIGGRSLTKLTNILYRSNLTDEPTCYKVFRADVLKSIPLRCKGFEFCPEVTAKILKKGIKIVEVPISHKQRTYREGKKIRPKDWFIAVWTLLKYRFRS